LIERPNAAIGETKPAPASISNPNPSILSLSTSSRSGQSRRTSASAPAEPATRRSRMPGNLPSFCCLSTYSLSFLSMPRSPRAVAHRPWRLEGGGGAAAGPLTGARAPLIGRAQFRRGAARRCPRPETWRLLSVARGIDPHGGEESFGNASR
jgi:hypothetical protein